MSRPSRPNRPRDPNNPNQQLNRPQQGNYQQTPQQGQQPQQGYPQQGQQPYQANQQGYPQQGQPYQQQTVPQGRPMPPQAPQAVYRQPLPPQQPAPQPQKIYIEKKSNPLITGLKMIAFPFVKVFQMIAGVFTIILQEMVRSIVSFVLGLALLALFVALVGGYIFALIQTDFDFVAAVPEMWVIFQSLLGMGGM